MAAAGNCSTRPASGLSPAQLLARMHEPWVVSRAGTPHGRCQPTDCDVGDLPALVPVDGVRCKGCRRRSRWAGRLRRALNLSVGQGALQYDIPMVYNETESIRHRMSKIRRWS